ncbi:hypothetical protein KIW84_057474 [Lathyrus oleraceus]|uniref:DEK C-terminal domain-containing protein n=1 Tax=Pisum sativum TaxID=3888 RepID=A0A9D4X165_PEA|nr:hypothetical protein KIW84_057474 [Pisum sativum]
MTEEYEISESIVSEFQVATGGAAAPTQAGPAPEVKKNISRFSGFVWYENEEKQMIKVKEKLDKCNKEKLLDVCDVLDIQVAKANTRKEDIIAKLINFLVAPHVTRAVLLEEQEKSIKGKKRKRITKQGSSRSGASTSKRSAKATFTDILKLLDKQFDTDLTPRKASLKTMIQEELTKLADEDEEDSKNDETHTSGKEIEA